MSLKAGSTTGNIDPAGLIRPEPTEGTMRKVTFGEWLAEAHNILRTKHNAEPSAIRPWEWTRLYVRGLSPEEAAQHASVEASNALTPNERRLRRR